MRPEGRVRRLFACAASLAALLLAGCGPLPPPPEPSRAQRIYQEGQLAIQQGNTQKALERFEAAAALAAKEGNSLGVTSSLHAIALVHIQAERWREALSYMLRVLSLDRKALEEARRAGAPQDALRLAEAKVASDLYDIARLHRRLGAPGDALRRLQEALQIDLRLGRDQGAAITHNNIGRLLLALDRLDEAEAHFKQALAIFQKREDKERALEVWNNLIFLERVRRTGKGR
ncbi:MAG: tetratricopeptide repeat protein [Candidatus Tectomicrobia bacterium]|uniref:Tetratricopeptide repeat protein n=1 Tax=Tectimicrobiota bacterium TaxID=2528274 RepID=A0A932HZW1_UNCTE|nr:tetratricopeptide repeat protein [Candidatus Tectomicrobia bacterium]